MKLLVTDVRQLFDYAESYFRVTKARCHDGVSSRYSYSGKRCVIGDMIMTETEYEVYWLSQFRGIASGLLAGMFGVHPNTKLSQAATEIQALHDAEDHWVSGAGFTDWDQFFNLKREYIR